jgi:hypothetical protein
VTFLAARSLITLLPKAAVFVHFLKYVRRRRQRTVGAVRVKTGSKLFVFLFEFFVLRFQFLDPRSQFGIFSPQSGDLFNKLGNGLEKLPTDSGVSSRGISVFFFIARSLSLRLLNL